jgi:hypothetical protein
MGSSPLIVSFYAPTWLLEPQNMNIALRIQSTPQSTTTCAKTLGFEMNVYNTTLGDGDNVYITKHLSNQPAFLAVCDIADADGKINDPPSEAIRTTITANVDLETAQIVGLTGRVDVLSEDAKASLRGQAVVRAFRYHLCHCCNSRLKPLTAPSSVPRHGATLAEQDSNRPQILVCGSCGSHSWSYGRGGVPTLHVSCPYKRL